MRPLGCHRAIEAHKLVAPVLDHLAGDMIDRHAMQRLPRLPQVARHLFQALGAQLGPVFVTLLAHLVVDRHQIAQRPDLRSRLGFLGGFLALGHHVDARMGPHQDFRGRQPHVMKVAAHDPAERQLALLLAHAKLADVGRVPLGELSDAKARQLVVEYLNILLTLRHLEFLHQCLREFGHDISPFYRTIQSGF
jgi:hypothetical protein